MPANGTEATGGQSACGIGWPVRAPQHLSSGETAGDAQTCREIEETLLLACGRRGYRNVTVAEVLELYGGNRSQFYRHFPGKAECYAAAYRNEIERLVVTLMDTAAARSSWRECLGAALKELAQFAVRQADLARGLLVEVHTAAGPALDKREEIFQRLSRAIDSARNEFRSHHPPPPITPGFMLNAIEAAVCEALEKGEPQRFAEAVPEMTQMIASAYLSDQLEDEGR